MKKNFWKENGVLISLYGVVGLLIVAAGVLTVDMFATDNEYAKIEDNVQVESNLSESYKDKESELQNKEREESLEKLKKQLEKDRNSEEEPKNDDNGTSLNEEEPTEEKKENNEEARKNPEEKELKEESEEKTEEESEENEVSAIYSKNTDTEELEKINKESDEEARNEQEEPVEDTEDEEESTNDNEEARNELKEIEEKDKKEMENFEESRLTWPVEGAIVMDFDDESLVYDETLDQYRTNDSISIEAEKGEEVHVSADGKVVEVGTNLNEKGYIVVDHGNGYQTKYSQLSEEFIVERGDEVMRGQIIGHVGTPSTTTVKQGTHLQYEVAINGENTNPLMFLE